MLRRQEDLENGTAWSNSSESSDDSSSPQLSLGLRHAHKNLLVQPEVQAAAPIIDISFTPRQSATSTPTRLVEQTEEDKVEEDQDQQEDEPRATTIMVTSKATDKQTIPNGHTRYLRSLSHISESSMDAALTERLFGESLDPSVFNDEPQQVESDTDISKLQISVQTVDKLVLSSVNTIGDKYDSTEELPFVPCTHAKADSILSSVETELQQSEAIESDNSTKAQDTKQLPQTSTGVEEDMLPANRTRTEITETNDCLNEALGALLSSLDDYRGQFPELHMLEQEVRLLEEALTVSTYIMC